MNVEFADVTALVDHIIYNTALKDVVCYIDGSRSLRRVTLSRDGAMLPRPPLTIALGH
jgi:hypothetical protein